MNPSFTRAKVYRNVRAALSVPTRIVEGSRRQGRQDYANFLDLAEASLAESEYLITVCIDVRYLSRDLTEPLLGTAGRIFRKLHLLRSRVEDLASKVQLERPRPLSRREAACLARSRRPSPASPDNGLPLRAPDASAKREALSARGDSRDAPDASAERDALDASRAVGEPSTAPDAARVTPGRRP